MEQHLQVLKQNHGFPECLEYKQSCIDKPHIRTGKAALFHQLFFPAEQLETFKNRYISFDYNGRTFIDVMLAEVEDRIIKTNKDYIFARSKMSELHICCREWPDSHRFEIRDFAECPKA